MVSVTLARMPVAELIRTNVDWQTNPPLFELTLHAWIKLFGDSELAVRMLPALFGIAGVLMAYILVRRLIGSRGAGGDAAASRFRRCCRVLAGVPRVHVEHFSRAALDRPLRAPASRRRDAAAARRVRAGRRR